jgi:hypothetical protein
VVEQLLGYPRGRGAKAFECMEENSVVATAAGLGTKKTIKAMQMLWRSLSEVS